MPNKYSIVVEDDALLADVAQMIHSLKSSTRLTGHCVCVLNHRILFRVNKNKTNYSIYAYRIRREKDAPNEKV